MEARYPRRRRLLLIGGIAALAVGLLVALAVARSWATGARDQAVSPDFPDFPIVLYQGAEHLGGSQPRFGRLLGSRPIVLNYWASNCPPCSTEMPEFEKVWQQYRGQVLFLGLDVGRFFPGFGDQARSREELRQLGITYPAGTPPSVEVLRQLSVPGLPTTQFITPRASFTANGWGCWTRPGWRI